MRGWINPRATEDPHCFCTLVDVLGPVEQKPKFVPTYTTTTAYDRSDAAPAVQAIQESFEQKYGQRPAEPETYGHAVARAQASAALNAVDRGVLDVEKIAEAVHRGWANVAVTYANQTPEQRQRRAVLASTPYDKLSEDEKQRDRTVARAVLKLKLPAEIYWGHRDVQPYHHPGPNPVVSAVTTRKNPATGRSEVLLVQRNNNSQEAGRWAVPSVLQETSAPKGQPWKPGAQTWWQAIAGLLGLTPKKIKDDGELVGKYERHGHDSKDNDEAWSAASVYRVNLPKKAAEAAVPVGSRWFPFEEIHDLPLAFDHRRILMDAGVK